MLTLELSINNMIPTGTGTVAHNSTLTGTGTVSQNSTITGTGTIAQNSTSTLNTTVPTSFTVDDVVFQLEASLEFQNQVDVVNKVKGVLEHPLLPGGPVPG
jgi:hypothetical protein